MKQPRNKFEQKIWDELTKLKISFKYESQKLQYKLEKQYVPDFSLDNGIIIESKGYFRQADRAKMVAVKKANPQLDIRFVFQKDKPCYGKRSKMMYSDWCKKYSFPYSIGSVPKSWFKQ